MKVAQWLAAAACLSLVSCSPPADEAPDAASPASLQQRLDALTINLERAEAMRAIKRVQRAYGHYSELGLWHDLADLFADEAVGNYPAGVLVGKEKIRELFYKDVGRNTLGLAEGRLYPHIVLSPVVTLSPDGQSAHGRWRILAMLGGYGGNASWAGGSYENQYVKERGVWKISHLSFFSQYGGRYEEGLKPFASGAPHFDAQRAAAPIEVRGTGEASSAPLDLASLGARVPGIERRAQQMIDEAEVTNLQHLYGYLFDRKQWGEIAALFTEDGTLEIGLRGVYVGPERIRRALSTFNADSLRQGEVHDHLQLQTFVSIAPDGMTARARTTEVSMTGIRGQHAEWGEGIAENEFVKRDGEWKLRAVHFYPRMLTDYKLGWARSALPTAGPSASFPPDRPPSQRYEVYPKFHIPPFHFPHPVTGKPPQYPAGTEVPATALISNTAGAAAPAANMSDVPSRLKAAEAAVARALAYDAVQNLVDAYGYFLDERMWADASSLFTADAVHALPETGVKVGPDEIRAALETHFGRPPEGFAAIHKIAQPVIAVAPDARSARVRARLFKLEVRAQGDDAFVAGEYDIEALRDAQTDTWKLKSVRLAERWRAGYREGWGGGRSVDTAGAVGH